jgi:precorrin-4/cobalt-precorrin-4 C11-methyltransferase
MIYFVGAGPGDVDLITVKGRILLCNANVVIYAGSLVWEEHLKVCRRDCLLLNSASMTLEEVLEVYKEHDSKDSVIIRLHTGDPTLYGAIREQIKALSENDMPFEVIPGVSSFTAACAALNREFTVPGVSQTVIVTRLEGRTPVPEKEDLELLASHQCSMAIFLSVQEIDKVIEKLKKGYQRDDVPIAIVYKASWPDQKIIKGTLEDIGEKVKEADISRFAQILVGDFIEGDFERSLLYDPEFTHGYRKGNA